MKRILMANTHVMITTRDRDTDAVTVSYEPVADGESINETLIPSEWSLAEIVDAFTRDNGIHQWQWADDDYPEWIACEDTKVAKVIANALEMKALLAQPSQEISIEIRTIGDVINEN